MKVVIVLEYPEDGDQAQTSLVDLDKLDMSNEKHKAYREACEKAMADEFKQAETKVSYSYGDDLPQEALAELPCMIEDDITLYIG